MLITKSKALKYLLLESRGRALKLKIIFVITVSIGCKKIKYFNQ